MDGFSQVKASKLVSCTKKPIIWSTMVMLLLVTIFFTFDEIVMVRQQHAEPLLSLKAPIVTPMKHAVGQKTCRQEMDAKIFEMIGSESNLKFVEKMKSCGFDCGKVWENTNITKTQVYVKYLNESTGIVEILIETYNHLNQRKTSGGDIFVIWAEQKLSTHSLMSSNKIIAGTVKDYLNGSYTGSLQIRWNGMFTVYTRLISIPRTQCLRFKAMEKYGNSVFSLLNSYGIFFKFENGNLTDSTRCAPIDFIYGYEELCNFTILNYNYSYYCGHPSSGLNCSDLTAYNMRKYNLNSMDLRRPEEDVIYDPGWGKLAKAVDITITKLTDGNRDGIDILPACHSIHNSDSWTMSPTQIFIQNDSWSHISCKPIVFTQTNIRRCLANKNLFFLGDSTVRQYVDVLGSEIKEHVKYFPFTVKLYSERDNINITWRKHELPFHNVEFRNPYKVNSTDNQLRNIANDSSIKDSNLIIVLTYNTHLQAFPPYVFRDRIKRLVKALNVLFVKKPSSTVLFKGPHVTNIWNKWFDARISLIYMEILLEEFASIREKVRYLDVFTLSVLNDNQSLHPRGKTLKNQLQQFLSYICP